LNKDEVQEETKKIPPLKIASFNRVQNLKFVPKSNVKEENL
jgi:hypothetical protein